YWMQAWVVMPNHVHLVLDVWDVPLVKLINGWKGKSSRLVNALLRRSGKFWQEDYYDTLVRDEAHLKRAVRYTEQNPVKAFLTKAARDWPWSSASHRRAAFMPLQRAKFGRPLEISDAPSGRTVKRPEGRAPMRDRGRNGGIKPPPLPPNRTGGFPAYGSPVSVLVENW